jgi:pimeloyl-ACP methyl ester carboxylesterase/CHAT domain-containing protein
MTHAHSSDEITFVVTGQLQPGVQARRGAEKVAAESKTVRLATPREGGAQPVRLVARPGQDVVVLTLENGPRLVLHPEHARDLLRAQSAAGAAAASEGVATEWIVPPQLGWPGLEAVATRSATRGWLGQVVLKTVEVVTGLVKDNAADLAAAAITAQVDGLVDEGLYLLNPDTLASLKDADKLTPAPAALDGGPLLVLLHGTFVDTATTFGKLWKSHPQKVAALFSRYKNRVYGFDHATLGPSPISNALALANALPKGAKLHLLSHSRGGLVAEVLARACGEDALSDTELALFEGEPYAAHKRDLQALVALVRQQNLKVERLVRVACPAHGTLLASKRLDAYLSVLQWGLELAGVPVAPQLVDFLNQVACRRADPVELPGLEALMPTSPVVAWLNNREDTIAGDLRVVAGDVQGDSVVSWVKTLLSDGFYWTDNDLIVQTRSMYGGTPRAVTAGQPGVSFLLDRAGNVSHFSYFANEVTASAITRALLDDAPAGFAAIGPLSWAGEDASGLRSRRTRAERGPSATRPAVILLPGVLGSHLKRDDKRIWMSLRFLLNGLEQLQWSTETADLVQPDGPIGMSYDDLHDHLEATHDVEVFAYDWRRPIEDEARRLGAVVQAALTLREATQQPVRLLAHSMGGLVARTLQLEVPEVWKRMMAREGARLVMLGTPNGGSWAPMQTLSGDDTMNNLLVVAGSPFHNAKARATMAGMPGFIQMQAGLLDARLNLNDQTQWDHLVQADKAALQKHNAWHQNELQRTLYDWSAPPQAVLDQAAALRHKLDKQAANLGADAQKMLVVVGQAPQTPCGIVMGEEGLEYLSVADAGDGRVTHQSAMLPGVRTWQVAATHGQLPDEASAFAAYTELLMSGQTTRLEALSNEAARGAGVNAGAQRSRPSRSAQCSQPPSRPDDVLGACRAAPPPAPAARPLQVTMLNANLKFVSEPLLVGHCQSVTLTGAEAVVNRLMDNHLHKALDAGLYPSAPGSHHIFENHCEHPIGPHDMPRPGAAVVVGLGEEGKLTVANLAYSVRQAVLAYARRLFETQGGYPCTEFALTSTLLGSGGLGVNPGSAAQAIVQGALDANLKLQHTDWPRLARVTLVELYLERAVEAWRALQHQREAHDGAQPFELANTVQFGHGALRRPLDSGYRSASYDFISALSAIDLRGNPYIAYKLDTKRARAEVRAQHAQTTLLRSLVKEASNNANTSPQMGRTLFNLLVPLEVEPFLGGTTEMVMELDATTAAIPWELLQTNPTAQDAVTKTQLPWAIRSKLIRKLQTDQFCNKAVDADIDGCVLVIGEPLCDPARYPRLPGAQREAQAVVRQFKAHCSGMKADQICALVDQPDAPTIIGALFERPYRVVHVAGHGEPGQNGGVVLSGDSIYLGANEVRAMRVVPELVFLNCCHLGGRSAENLLQTDRLSCSGPYDRTEFAANIADELIRMGVRCVVAAGWAVEDGPAEAFAATFYAALLQKERFMEAVSLARKAAWEANPSGNTWAAYQCYGDPEWRWRDEGGIEVAQPRVDKNEFGAISTPLALAWTLEELAVNCEHGDIQPDQLLTKLDVLDHKFGPLWGTSGAVAEAFGLAYANAKINHKAIEWYQKAVEAEDGSASMRAAEQLGTMMVRHAEKQNDPPGLQEGLAYLQTLVNTQPTMDRHGRLGSAYKRMAMLQWRKGQAHEAGELLTHAIHHYRWAENQAAKVGDDRRYLYPAKNALSAELSAAFLRRDVSWNVPDDAIASLQTSLDRVMAQGPNFWELLGQIELQILQALTKRQLASVESAVCIRWQELKNRVPAPQKWESVHNATRFSLEPYAELVSSEERRAAQNMLVVLKTMAVA